jgi:hypothetical protein
MNSIFYLCGGTLGTAATTGLLYSYQPRMIGDGDCGEIGGMKIGRGNRSTRRKLAPAPLCPPQIPGRRGGEPATKRLSYGAARNIMKLWFMYLSLFYCYSVARGSIVVEALCCKPEGRWIASRCGGFFSNLSSHFGGTMRLGSTQPLTDISTRNR